MPGHRCCWCSSARTHETARERAVYDLEVYQLLHVSHVASIEICLHRHLAALDTNSNSFFFRGPIGLRYAVEVSNPADEPVTLRRLELHSIGGGAYMLRAGSTPMNLKVAPKSDASFAITTWGRSLGGEIRSDEPVTIVGRAYFDSPKGPFVKIFQENVWPRP